ncbi:MAG: hypothetical protein EB168_08340, partial [Euryarchaeota archaeon]|nr:hypothetical protein [Euryarchaeota archaeon]
MDNGSLPPVDHYLNLHLFRNYQGDNDTELKLRFSTTDNDTRYVRAQLDNATAPDPYDWYHWIPLDNFTLMFPLDNSTQVQEQTLYIWLKDEAGNIDNLTPKNIYWAQLYSGEKRLDNDSAPKADLNDNLSLKYSRSLSAQHPLDNKSVKDNESTSVGGTWSIDNDSLVFNPTLALTPEMVHRLDAGSWNENDNITFYAAQTFKFNSDDVITIFIH